MISRILVTLVMFFFAIYAFWSGAFDEGHIFNPFGILFLVLTVIIWFAWETIRDALRTAKNESSLPIERLGLKIIQGMQDMKRPPQGHRRSDEPS